MPDAPVPARLREAREWMGFSVEQVAQRLNVAPSVIELMESGGAAPSDGFLAQLGELYRRPIPWFHGETTYVRRDPPPGVILCGAAPPTKGDLDVVHKFLEWLQGAGRAPGRHQRPKGRKPL